MAPTVLSSDDLRNMVYGSTILSTGGASLLLNWLKSFRRNIYVGKLSPGTLLVFTYVHSGVLDGSVSFEGGARIRHDVARIGEPWTFGINPAEASDFLLERGLVLDQDSGARDYRAKYFGPSSERMKGYEFYHVATAHVPNKISPS